MQFECKKCNREFRNPKYFKYHKCDVGVTGHYQCELCVRVLKTLTSYVYHRYVSRYHKDKWDK